MTPLFAALSNVVPWSVAYDPLAGFLFAGLFAFVAAAAVFADWRRKAALAVFRALAALSASAFIAFYLPLLLLPEAAVNWWFD